MEELKMNMVIKQLNLRLNDNKTFCIMLGLQTKKSHIRVTLDPLVHV